MNFFTPELYLRFNSQDRAVAERAHDEWESAIQSYREHLRGIGPRMSAGVRCLAENLCLHDASYLGLTLPSGEKNASLAVLMTRRDTTAVFLVYLLAEEPLIQECRLPWPFSQEEVHWLYDEFDVDAKGTQRHEVLLSNGRVLTLRFHELQLIKHDFAGRLVA